MKHALKAIVFASLLCLPARAADVLLEAVPVYWPLNTANRLQAWNVPFTVTTNNWGTVFLTRSNTVANAELAFQPCSTGGVWVADSLAVGATNVYRLYSGHASTATPLITLATNAEHYQATNSLIGVRIVRSTANLALQRAPLQGARTRDGTWFSTNETSVNLGPWLYRWRTDATMDVRDTNRLAATNLVTTVVESGPVLFQVRNVYEFSRPAYNYAGVASYAASYGYLTNTVTLAAEMPDVFFEDITNMELWYGLHIQDVLTPNRLRGKGHAASQASWGYNEGNGTRYEQPNTGPNFDWTRDISTTENLVPSDGTADGTLRKINICYPWPRFLDNAGWYEQAFASGGAGTSPVIGVAVGPSSKAKQMGNSGVSWYSKASTRWGFVVAYRHRGDDNAFSTDHRSQWMLFIDQKANLPAYSQMQPIAMQQNLFAGINLTKLSRYVLDFTDRSDGYNHLFMSPALMTNVLIGPVRNDVNIYNYYFGASGQKGQRILDYWRENANGVQHASLPVIVFNTASNLFESLINGDGVFDNDNGGMRAGMQALDMLANIDVILGDQHATATQKRQARLAGAALGYMLWDNDFTPLDVDTRVPLGTPNQILQYNANRNSFAFEFPNHVYFAEQVEFATNNVVELIRSAYNSYGVAAETPHYIEAAFGPLIQNCLQLQQTPGALDPFQVEKQRMTNLARFYLQLLTPIEPRFGSSFRKRATWGDGSTEGTWVPGALATGMAAVDTNLAAELLGAWKSMGKPHSEQFITTILTINESGASNALARAHENFPGGMSVLRVWEGTTNESVCWLPNGTWYNDHRHQQDWGSGHIYALGAPLAIHPGCLYTPRVNRMTMQNCVVNENNLASPWNLGQSVGGTSSTAGSFTDSATNANFVALGTSGWADAVLTDGNGRRWTRSVRLVGVNRNMPIYHVHDTFSENASRVLQWHFAADNNAVTTPSGSYTVTAADDPSQPPGNASVVTLSAGVAGLTFQGQTWNSHTSGGINWKVFFNSSEAKSFSAGAWGNLWNNDKEQIQYRTANGVGTYRERLTEPRVKGNEDFNQLIVPYRKNFDVTGLTVTTNGATWRVEHAGRYWRIGTNDWDYTEGSLRKALAVWSGTAPVSATNGLEIAGGPAELDLRVTNTVFTAHGNSGKRTFGLPAGYP
jgi:hypothetical protein